MGILKPALWHTPAITNDGIIRQAPDPREKHEGFTPRPQQGVEMRTSSTGLQHTLTYTVYHWPVYPGCQQGWHYLWVLCFHQRVQEVQYLSHTPACCTISCTPAFTRPRRIHCRETLQGLALITCPADKSHYFPPTSYKELCSLRRNRRRNWSSDVVLSSPANPPTGAMDKLCPSRNSETGSCQQPQCPFAEPWAMPSWGHCGLELPCQGTAARRAPHPLPIQSTL